MTNCIICQQPIPTERLEALPNTRLCVSCASKRPEPARFDPNEVCAKASLSARNGFAPNE